MKDIRSKTLLEVWQKWCELDDEKFDEWLHTANQRAGINTPVTSSNAFEKLPLHWKLIVYYSFGIATGIILHYCW